MFLKKDEKEIERIVALKKENTEFSAEDAEYISAKDDRIVCGGSVALGEDGFFRMTKAEREHIKKVNEAEAYFSSHTAGIQARFITDSPVIFVRAENTEKFAMTNMTQIGQGGCALYVYDEERGKYVFHDAAKPAFDGESYTAEIGHFFAFPRKERKFILYFPMYDGVKSMEIGIAKGSAIKPNPFTDHFRLTVYGTSITHGCCAAHPGTAYTNLLSRGMDAEVFNLGFSGTAFTEKEMGEILARRDTDMLIVDSEPNAGVDRRLYDNLPKFLDAFFEGNPDVPVILASSIKFAHILFDEYRRELAAFYRKFLKRTAKNYSARGRKVFYLDCSEAFGDDFTEFTVDGVHPTDRGMFGIYAAMKTKIDTIRRKSGI